MKNNVLKLSLAFVSLAILLSLLAACGDEPTTSPNQAGNTPGNSTPTGTPGTTSAITSAVTTTVDVSTASTTGATTSAVSVATSVAVPTPTSQPTTAPASATARVAPTATPAAVDTTTPETGATQPVTGPAQPIKVSPSGVTPTTTPGLADPAVLPGKITLENKGKIYVVNPNGSGLKQIASGESPVFSPDGQRIAFVSTDEKTINSVDLNGNALQTNCTTGGQFSRDVRWSPDSKYLATYNSKGQAPSRAVEFCDMTSKGTGTLETFLAGNLNSQYIFDWSLDEKKALFQVPSNETDGTSRNNLVYGDPNQPQSQWQSVTNHEYQLPLRLGLAYSNARISPTNKTVAIIGTQLFFKSTPGYKSIYDGLVLKEFNDVNAVAWSPDSTAILIEGSYNGQSGIYLRYFESGKVTRLTDFTPSGFVDWTRK